MPILTTEQILACSTLPEKAIPVPEWGEGGEVRIRALSKQRQQELRKASTSKILKDGALQDVFDQDAFELAMFVAGVVEPQFTQDQAKQLAQLAAGPIDRVVREVLDLSGLTRDGKVSQEAVKEAEKSAS